MKFYSVSARYTPKGLRKARGAFGYVFANSEEEAKAKFSARVTLPTDLYISWFIDEVNKDVIVAKYY